MAKLKQKELVETKTALTVALDAVTKAKKDKAAADKEFDKAVDVAIELMKQESKTEVRRGSTVFKLSDKPAKVSLQIVRAKGPAA